MTLAFSDRAALHITRALPRKKGEDRTAYAARFFREIKGLGNVALFVVRGNRRRVIARRAF